MGIFLSLFLNLAIGIMLSGVAVLFPFIYLCRYKYLFYSVLQIPLYHDLYCCSNCPRLAIWQCLRHRSVAGDTSVNQTNENLSRIVAFVLVRGGVER